MLRLLHHLPKCRLWYKPTVTCREIFRAYSDDNKTPDKIPETSFTKEPPVGSSLEGAFEDAGSIEDYYDDWYEEPSVDQVGEIRQRNMVTTPIPLTRGVRGVFDVEDLVTHLRHENALNIVSIRVPREMNYCEHMVIASCKSKRHISAVSESVRKLHKLKRGPQDTIPNIEGARCQSDWLAMDMMNIVLHLFMPETRVQYDLECLWTVGSDFDDTTKRMGVSGDAVKTEASPFSQGGRGGLFEDFDWEALAEEVVQDKRNKNGTN